MICPNCNTQNDDENLYCLNCGFQLKNTIESNNIDHPFFQKSRSENANKVSFNVFLIAIVTIILIVSTVAILKLLQGKVMKQPEEEVIVEILPETQSESIEGSYESIDTTTQEGPTIEVTEKIPTPSPESLRISGVIGEKLGSVNLVMSVQNVYREEILDKDMNPIIDKQAIIIDIYIESLNPDGQLRYGDFILNYDNGNQLSLTNSKLLYEGYHIPNKNKYHPDFAENRYGLEYGESIRGYLYYVIPADATGLYLTLPESLDVNETLTIDLENSGQEKYNPQQSESAYAGIIGDEISNKWFKLSVLNYQVNVWGGGYYYDFSDLLEMKIDLLAKKRGGEDYMRIESYLQDDKGFIYLPHKHPNTFFDFNDIDFHTKLEGDVFRGDLVFLIPDDQRKFTLYTYIDSNMDYPGMNSDSSIRIELDKEFDTQRSSVIVPFPEVDGIMGEIVESNGISIHLTKAEILTIDGFGPCSNFYYLNLELTIKNESINEVIEFDIYNNFRLIDSYGYWKRIGSSSLDVLPSLELGEELTLTLTYESCGKSSYNYVIEFFTYDDDTYEVVNRLRLLIDNIEDITDKVNQ